MDKLKFKFPAELSDDEIGDALLRNDGTRLHEILENPECQKFALIRNLGFCIQKVKSNSILLNMVAEYLLPRVTVNDEAGMREVLRTAILCLSSAHYLQIIDRVWLQTQAEQSLADQCQRLKQLYSEVEHGSGIKMNYNTMIQRALTLGIRRHVLQLLSVACLEDTSHLIKKCNYFKAKIVAICTKEPFRNWYEELEVIDTRIQPSTATPPVSDIIVQNTVIPNLLSKMDKLSKSSEAKAVRDAAEDLFRSLSEDVAQRNPILAFTPILTGSAAEGTRCFYSDEFDYVLLFKHWTIKHIIWCRRDFQDILSEVLLKRSMNQLCRDKRLVFERFNVVPKYPCLRLCWIGEEYRDMTISIDLVPAVHIDRPVKLSLHNYLPGPHVAGCEFNSLPHVRFITDKTTLYGDKCTSVLENEIIKTVPSYIREGYKLSKAMRISQIIQPVVPQLIEFGVTDDLHNLIRTYYLKTCVLFLTENHQHNPNDTNDPWWWAIRIYEKLKDFLIQGKLPQFYDEEMKFECQHGNQDDMPRGQWCCRRRAAMLVIVDRILVVLRARVRILETALSVWQLFATRTVRLPSKP